MTLDVLQRVDAGHGRRLERRLAVLVRGDAEPQQAVDPAAARVLLRRPQRPDGTALANGLDGDDLGRRVTAVFAQLREEVLVLEEHSVLPLAQASPGNRGQLWHER
jgi:hypothetical protein